MGKRQLQLEGGKSKAVGKGFHLMTLLARGDKPVTPSQQLRKMSNHQKSQGVKVPKWSLKAQGRLKILGRELRLEMLLQPSPRLHLFQGHQQMANSKDWEDLQHRAAKRQQRSSSG